MHCHAVLSNHVIFNWPVSYKLKINRMLMTINYGRNAKIVKRLLTIYQSFRLINCLQGSYAQVCQVHEILHKLYIYISLIDFTIT